MNRFLNIILFLAVFLISHLSSAQEISVSGKVVGADDNEGIPGVNILIKGTETGTVTDFNGNYNINIPSDTATMIFSFVGYQTKTIAVNNRSTIDVALRPDVTELTEIVVTALGIEKDKKALGYSSQQVGGEDLSEAREANFINSLSGKVSGVQITNSGTGPGGSSKVSIRGLASIAGNNSPLFVVDGIPVDNATGGGSQFGGIDYGSAISNINPDDIASINVLKGASATALYGSRGQNGVIMITTKKGRQREGIGVTFNSNLTMETPLVYPDFQNSYGRGSNNNFPYFNQGPNIGNLNDNINSSWGEQMEGQTQFMIGDDVYPMENWTGEVTPYAAQPDNYRDFWRTGLSNTNTITMSGGNETTTGWASISHLENQSIMPNSEFSRTTINLRLTNKFGEKLSMDAKVNYIYQDFFNRPNLTLNPDNPVKSLVTMPRNIRLSDLQNYITNNGRPRVFTNATSLDQWQNPYWAVNLNTNNDKRDRVLGFIKMNYDFTDWLSAYVRVGTDLYFDERERRIAPNTIYKINDEYSRYEGRVQETNVDFLITAQRDISSKLDGVLAVGGNLMHQNSENSTNTALGLDIPYYYNFTNASGIQVIPGFREKEIQSLYATLDLNYDNYLYVQLTGRNDWSSTLPPESWSYFYPSVSTSFVFTDAWDLGIDWLSYGKIRASYAFVGNDTNPYQLDQLYAINALTHDNQKFAQIISPRPSRVLRNELTQSFEVGGDLSFFLDRIRLDFTYYNAGTSNQLIALDVSRASGFEKVNINSGLIRNQGVELMLNTVPIESEKFSWNIDLNFTRNYNEMVELDPEVKVQDLGTFDQFGVQIVAEEGRPFGDIYALKAFSKDPESGQRLINSQGLPIVAEDPELIGNYLPDFQAGISNTLRYGSFNLSFLVDLQKGGDIYSYTNATMAALGNSAATLEKRRFWYAGAGGYVADGILPDGTQNDIEVDPEEYWRNVGGQGGGMFAEAFLYDASYIKLREARLTYRMPSNLINKLPFTSATLSLVGRNLAILLSNTPGFDPEATFNTGNAQGIEAYAFPSTRSLGFNLNLQF